jgi:DMSO reductase anchor subunit
LSIIGIILAFILAIRAFTYRMSTRSASSNSYRNGATTKSRQQKTIWLIVSLVLGVAGIALFFIAEDFSRLMVIVNNLTIVFVAILVLEIVAYVLAFKRTEVPI